MNDNRIAKYNINNDLTTMPGPLLIPNLVSGSQQTVVVDVISARGEVTRINEHSSLIIGLSVSADDEFGDDVQDEERPYPDIPESGQSEYDAWLG